jgi:hypothetical protein
MNSLWRSLSGASSKEITHTHPSHPIRPTTSLDIGECRLECFQSQFCNVAFVHHGSGRLYWLN